MVNDMCKAIKISSKSDKVASQYLFEDYQAGSYDQHLNFMLLQVKA